MPLSWLPLIADYTKDAKNETGGTVWSAIGYFIGSTLMYLIGLGGALFAGTSDISEILISVGLPVIALFIVLFSTVTTTFLDVYSAAVSFLVIKKANEKVIR
jgi:purine-cytosine permease-like protein